ncbi:glycosyltransferase [Bifidobacterium primatium]|uniref:glycosyltransferase n=1 Tax=Bifidobacterium primatium TaxID=2045438 RepID=UPI0013FD4873|nr:glycosyltransferase [Bifidobacterium primatium]
MQDVVGGVLAECRVSAEQSVEPAVAAIITVEDDRRFLSRTLRSVLNQTVLPSVIVIADCTDEGQSATKTTVSADSSMQNVEVRLVGAAGASSFGQAVRKALDNAYLPTTVRSLWLLHDDSRPRDASCLETMLEAWRNAPTAAVLGCKQVGWDEEETLHDVGCYATTNHGVASLVVDGEPDQEQYDARQDVYMVDLAGALVSLPVWRTLDGTDQAMGEFAESADFCRRVCLSGGRVLVVPKSAIAHRRARFEGLRTHDGEPTRHESARVSADLIDARERYRFTDIRLALWAPMWVWRLLVSIVLFIRQLVGKRPYEAACELGAPWRLLLAMPRLMGSRRKVARQSTATLRQLTVLVARRDQVAQWRERSAAFADSKNVPLLSPLAVAHLRRQRRRRLAWAAVMAVLAFVAGLLVNLDAWKALVTGGSFHSSTLVASAASWRQLFESATSAYTYADGLGVAAPPSPFLLVLLASSAVTLGHVTVAIGLMVFAAAPLSALSFWALAGIFTRSNPIRVVMGLLWCVFGGVLGLYSQGNLPMLTVMVFLPAAMAFAFRAVGMYHTEDVVSATASVQSAALASLCMMMVVAAEPQLVLPLLVVFAAFMVLVRSHRIMLLLIPVPGAFALAPTLLNVVLNLGDGSYRQLFADMNPASGDASTVSASNLFSLTLHAFGFGPGIDLRALPSTANMGALLTMLSLVALCVIAACALLLPFALRVSRMMWVIVVAGAFETLLAARMAVAPAQTGAVAGTTLPGLAFVMVGMLACVCMVAGRAAKPFSPLVSREVDHSRAIGSKDRGHYARRNLVIVARALLVLLLAACVALWGAIGGVRAYKGERLVPQRYELPLIAQDYLASGDGHRILALRADSSTEVSFSSMRTARGDLIDYSPSVSAAHVSTGWDRTSQTIAASSATLLQHNDDDAIAKIVDLGFGGIYIPYAPDSASRSLVSNILASDGTQSVVSNESGTYIRLTVDDTTTQGIDESGEAQALHSPWRWAWLWCMGIVTILYIVVAFPRIRRNGVKA